MGRLTQIIVLALALSGCLQINTAAFEKAHTACDQFGGTAEVRAIGFGKIEVTCGDGRAVVLKRE